MAQIDYKPGDVIQGQREPLIKFAAEKLTGQICNNCLKQTGQVKKCRGCATVFYCDKKCQSQDWNLAHKIECSSPCFRGYCRVGANREVKRHMFRLFVILSVNPASAHQKFPMYDGTERCFNDLTSHAEDEERDPGLVQEAATLQLRMKAENLQVTTERLVALFSIFKTNAFQIYNESELQHLGSGLYVEQSVFDHSCKPNAFFCSYGGPKMSVIANGPIAKGDAIFISYISRHAGKVERRALLAERYHFECHCARCETGSDADVDYATLNQLTQLMESNKASVSMTFQDLVSKHRKIMEWMRRIYYEYDYRIANQYMRFFYGIAETPQLARLPAAAYQELINEIGDHVRTTYGVVHYEYKQFQTGCAFIENIRAAL